MKRNIFTLLLIFSFLLPLAAEEVKTVDLDSIASGKVKAGLELGYPFTGLTAGYQMNNTMEVNLLFGSVLDFNSLALGANLLFTLVKLDVESENFPISAGPVVYSVIGNQGVTFSAGGVGRLEYDFKIPLNLFLQGGMIFNIVKNDPQDPIFNFPFSLGVRYIF